MVMHVLDTKTARDLHAARLRIAELEAALKPLADVRLWRDFYADALFDRAIDVLIDPAQIRAARAALALPIPETLKVNK